MILAIISSFGWTYHGKPQTGDLIMMLHPAGLLVKHKSGASRVRGPAER